MSSKQDAIDERLTNLEDKMQTLQVSIPQYICQFHIQQTST